LSRKWAEFELAAMHTKSEIAFRIVVLAISVILGGTGLTYLFKKSEDPAGMLFKCLLTVPLVILMVTAGEKMGGSIGLLVIGTVSIVLALVWTPHIANWIASPLTSLFDGGSEPAERKPFYSIANTKRKRGLYQEAVAETRKQLARFPNDYEGVLLLAAIQAENLQDLSGAENTLNSFCAHTKSPDQHVASAWTQLADWHLKPGQDVDSARAVLQKIADHFPGTELSLRAEQRMAHLVETEKILLAQHNRERKVVPEGVHNLGLQDSMKTLRPPEIEPGKLAEAHLKHLAEHPHDSDIREKLALIYARDFKRLDLATMELAVLINEPRHSPRQIGAWLNMLANFQVDLGADIATVRDTLQKIVDNFPDLPLAQVTQRRLARLDSEFKAKAETPGIKLGVYEQNIGLKYGSPRKL
jgi:hypothetical protein